MKKYQLFKCGESNNGEEKYYVYYNGRLIMDDTDKRFILKVDNNNKRVVFRVSTIPAKLAYDIMSIIRKDISKTYSIKCI